TANGMGQFMDDVKIEDWGTVGIADSPERKISVYNNNGIISIESEFVLEQVELTIVNASGQTLLSEKVSGVRSIEKSIELTSGVYIVSLKGKGFEKNTKLFIN
ncbi:MAG: T9SS type A sorting domain-containing protein, partial [Ignavibacteria bacterium]|nr:T9SS type A sorting domain-containing protein [Ignavibacteria bacterium]